MISVSAAAQKWASGMQSAGPAIKAGVAAVTTAPGQAAAANQAGYLSGVQNNVNKWATNTAAVSLPSWQNSMTTKGIQNISSGIPGGQAKWTAAMNTWFPVIQSAVASLPPRGPAGSSQNYQRSQQLGQALHAQAAAGAGS
jgi:hypothetical protein